MNLRLRLIIVFFLLSVVPLGAITFYTYVSNASAMRDAAGREAQMLAGDLTDRMKLVTAQLSQRFERLMDLPAAGQPQSIAVSVNGGAAARGSTAAATASTTREESSADEATAAAARLSDELGELALLLNNIEVRGFGRGRRGFGARGTPDTDASGARREPGAGGGDPFAGRRGGGGVAAPSLPPGSGAESQAPPRSVPGIPAPENPPDPSSAVTAGQGARVGGSGAPPTDTPDDPGRIRIDLGPVRRELLQQIFPERERWDELSQQERELIQLKVNERMLGIQQGIQILRQKATEQAADARSAAEAAVKEGRASRSNGSGTPQTAPRPTAPAAPLQRQTALSGSRIDVRVLQGGQVVGQVNADINLPSLLATVFTTTQRDQGEVPFAVDQDGSLYTPTDSDRQRIAALNTPAARADTPPGTALMSDWVVVTTADPTGSGLKFGIARPLGNALDDLRRSSARSAALGLGLIGLALIGIVPLSATLTRSLSRLSDGVNQMATGDYRARVNVTSRDEVGRLAGAFNRMAADVERHQQAAVKQERLRRELELGRQIQHDMLPRAPLRIGLTEVRGMAMPATEVGGDFFNYFLTPSGQLALIVGDVSGKGVGAALLMANIQASLRTRIALGQDLAVLAQELDADIRASTSDAVYATLFVGVLDTQTRTLDYVNAGHNPQFVLRVAGGLESMDSTGLPIGLLDGYGYGARRVHLAAGDTLFFYTDGCVEAQNPSSEMFGSARLEALLASRPVGTTDGLLMRVERELVAFRSGRDPFDDETMMVASVG